MALTRRLFLGGAATLAAGADPKTGMPTRILGRTGARVSILAFGAGSRFLMYKDEDKAAEALQRALDLGISYVDTANSYGNGQSEERVGKFLGARRKGIWLTTKVTARKADAAERAIEAALKRLRTDYVNLLHIHGLNDAKDLAEIEAPDGLLKVMYKMRDQKVARFIGITSHADPDVLKTALERHDFDCTQMALNAARAGRSKNPAITSAFETTALPVANRKNLGVIAMKIFAQEQLIGKAPVEKLIRYALSLPVSAAVAGMPTLAHIEENIRVAKAFQPLPPAEMKLLSDRLAGQAKMTLDRFFARHIDA